MDQLPDYVKDATNNLIMAEYADFPRILSDFNEYLPGTEQWCGPMNPYAARQYSKKKAGTYLMLAELPVEGTGHELFAYYVGTSDVDIGKRVYAHTAGMQDKLLKNGQADYGDSKVTELPRALHDGLKEMGYTTYFMISTSLPSQGGHAVEYRMLKKFNFAANYLHNGGRRLKAWMPGTKKMKKVVASLKDMRALGKEFMELITNANVATRHSIPGMDKLGYFLHELVDDDSSGLSGAEVLNDIRKELALVDRDLADVQHTWRKLLMTTPSSRPRSEVKATIASQVDALSHISDKVAFMRSSNVQPWADFAMHELFKMDPLVARPPPEARMLSTYLMLRHHDGIRRVDMDLARAISRAARARVGPACPHHSLT